MTTTSPRRGTRHRDHQRPARHKRAGRSHHPIVINTDDANIVIFSDGQQLWHNGNWIAESICAQVRPTFRWSANEVHHLLTAVEARIREEYGGWVRGGLGQSLWHLLVPDPNLTTAATEVIGMSLLADDLDIAFRALTLAQGRADDPRATVAEIMARYPELASHELAKAYVNEVESYGFVPVYG